MQQYLRKIRLKASGSSGSLLINHDDQALHDLKIEIDVLKNISSTQNPALIKIWNLTEGHRNALGKELDDITLEAGYMPPSGGNNVGIIFQGQIRDVEHRREGADIVTYLTNGEGDKAFRKATISKTYKAGTSVQDVVKDLGKELEKEGIKKGEWKFPDNMPEFKRPYAAVGSAKEQFDLLSRGYNFYWSVQNGVCEVIPGNGAIGQIVKLTPDTGLIGTPTITDNGIKVIALLNPEIRPNRKISVESSTLAMNKKSGEYRVSEVRYSGDNREGDMIVAVVGESIKDGKVDEGIKPEEKK